MLPFSFLSLAITSAIRSIIPWHGGDSRPWKICRSLSAAAIQEAEKMLRETKNVYEFNALFKRARGLPSLLQKRQPTAQSGVISWRENEYQKAKAAIEPSGQGLGKDFLRHFLPGGAIPKNDTLQSTITAYYQERWWREGQKLLDESQLLLWQAKETNDKEKMDASLELEKQARVLLGKVKQGGISRASESPYP